MKSALLVMGLAASVQAQPVQVTVTGEVEYNQINGGVLGEVAGGESATLTLTVDASGFVDGPNFPTRGYEIESFEIAFDSVSIGLMDPYQATPYFVIRNDDPAVDGFMITDDVEFPIGVSLDQTGAFGQFINNFYVTYGGDLTDSLDIEDVYGTYAYEGIQVFNWTVDDGPFNAMGLIFGEITIEPAGACDADINGDGSLDILDFVAYQNAFTSGDPSADCDANGQLNILDFVCYQNLFQAGCG